MLDANNVYEIEFDVPASHREQFENWLSEEVVTWVSHESVGYFEVFQNDKGLSPEVKFVFGFERLEDWTTFVGSEEHEFAIERLEHLAENREAVLWKRASVKLDKIERSTVADGGRTRSTDRRQSGELTIPS